MSIHRVRRTILGPRGRYTAPFGGLGEEAKCQWNLPCDANWCCSDRAPIPPQATLVQRMAARRMRRSHMTSFRGFGFGDDVANAISTAVMPTVNASMTPVDTSSVANSVSSGVSAIGGKIGGMFDALFGTAPSSAPAGAALATASSPVTSPVPTGMTNKTKAALAGAALVGYLLLRKKK